MHRQATTIRRRKRRLVRGLAPHRRGCAKARPLHHSSHARYMHQHAAQADFFRSRGEPCGVPSPHLGWHEGSDSREQGGGHLGAVQGYPPVVAMRHFRRLFVETPLEALPFAVVYPRRALACAKQALNAARYHANTQHTNDQRQKNKKAALIGRTRLTHYCCFGVDPLHL